MSEENVFPDIPQTPHGHLALVFYEAAYLLINHIHSRAAAAEKDIAAVFEEFPYLEGYFEALRPRLPDDISWGDSLAWLKGQVEGWENSVQPWLPLRALRTDAGLERASIHALLLAAFVEESATFSDLFATVQPNSQRRPTIDLISGILRESGGVEDPWRACRRLIEAGLVQVINKDDPRSEWQLRVPGPVWNAIRGEAGGEPAPGVHYHPPVSFSAASDLILPQAQRERLGELIKMMAGERAPMLVIRGLAGTERLEVAGAVARGTDRGILTVDNPHANDERYRLLGPLCTLTRSVPVFCLDLSPGETFDVPAPDGYKGPAAVVLGFEGGLSGNHSDRAISIQLEPEGEADRLRQWQRALNGNAAEDLASIASTFAMPGRYIRQSAPLACAYAALERRTSITTEDVRMAARAINRQLMDSLATRLEPGGGWAQLVARSSTQEGMQDLARRCRHRERLTTAMGDMPGGLSRGVRALFEGPSGTGKTLGARMLAGELKLDIYRVDLASVVNKYIGETEKNLSRVLSRAEDLNVVLLLDEGDALMTRRTDVKSANDRYANLETNYLLQRLDNYSGILIVTTNAGNNIDMAFRRRMDVVVSFHLPEAEQRWSLWTLHLPRQHRVDSVTLEEISVRFALTGGQIRNAAIHASLLAIDRGSQEITRDDLRAAILVEYRKAGAACPLDDTVQRYAEPEALTTFLGAIS